MCIGECDGEIIEALGAFIGKSMLRSEEDADGTPRLTMLETIREYAAELLPHAGDLEMMRERHGAYFLACGRAEVFLGMNPREREGRDKDAVSTVTSCYMDIDLPEGTALEAALEELTSGDTPLPSFVVASGYGLHVAYLLDAPSGEKAAWRKVQRGMVRTFADLGADRAVASDESRVLRLIPYPNRKRWPDGVPTALLYQSEARYTLSHPAEAFPLQDGTPFSRLELVTATPEPIIEDVEYASGEEAEEDFPSRVVKVENHRATLKAWIHRNLKPGIHYAIIPINGSTDKPRLGDGESPPWMEIPLPG